MRRTTRCGPVPCGSSARQRFRRSAVAPAPAGAGAAPGAAARAAAAMKNDDIAISRPALCFMVHPVSLRQSTAFLGKVAAQPAPAGAAHGVSMNVDAQLANLPQTELAPEPAGGDLWLER